MGCWNATCGLTGLPIRYNDPVVAMFIQDEAFGRIEGSRRDLTPSYVFSAFTPASFLVRGEYDDYGSVELDEQNNRLIMLTADEARRYSKDVLIEKEGEPPRYGYALGKLDKSFDIEDGHMQGGRGDDPARPFAIWMAHAGIFDKLVNEISEEHYERTNDEKGYRYVTRTIKESTQKRIADNLVKMQDSEERMFFDSPWRESSTLTGAAFRYIDSILVDHAASARRLAKAQGVEVPEADQVTPAMQELLIASWADLYALYMVMASLRLTLWPTGACGSQDGELAPYKVRWAAMNDYIIATEKRYTEEDGDEEDEDDDAEATA